MPMLDLFLVEHDWLFVAAAHETDCINHPYVGYETLRFSMFDCGFIIMRRCRRCTSAAAIAGDGGRDINYCIKSFLRPMQKSFHSLSPPVSHSQFYLCRVLGCIFAIICVESTPAMIYCDEERCVNM
jgi:hypothetical protein